MTYSSGGLIQATDYNNFAGGNGGGANVSGQLNTVLGTGNRNRGYGQTAVSNVTVGSTVTATQWTTLINGVNTVRKHQSGASFSNLGTYTAGTTINATTDIASNLTSAFTNWNSTWTLGTTVTGSTFSSTLFSANTGNTLSYSISRVATFANADAARYFWNSGGTIKYIVVSATNNDATQRSQDLANLAAVNFANITFLAMNNSGRAGTGGTLTSSNDNVCYWQVSTANTSASLITSTQQYYSNDTCNITAKTNGVQGTNADNGTTFTMNMDLFSGNVKPGPADSVNVTIITTS